MPLHMTIQFPCTCILYVLYTRALNSKYDGASFATRASHDTHTQHTRVRVQSRPTHRRLFPGLVATGPHEEARPAGRPSPLPLTAPALPQRGAGRSGARSRPGGGAARRDPHHHRRGAAGRVGSAERRGLRQGLPRAAPLSPPQPNKGPERFAAAAGERGGRGCRCRPLSLPPPPPPTHTHPPPPPRGEAPGAAWGPARRGAAGDWLGRGCEPKVPGGEAICSAADFARSACWGEKDGAKGGALPCGCF